jgi:hypothetical protein
LGIGKPARAKPRPHNMALAGCKPTPSRRFLLQNSGYQPGESRAFGFRPK